MHTKIRTRKGQKYSQGSILTQGDLLECAKTKTPVWCESDEFDERKTSGRSKSNQILIPQLKEGKVYWATSVLADPKTPELPAKYETLAWQIAYHKAIPLA